MTTLCMVFEAVGAIAFLISASHVEDDGAARFFIGVAGLSLMLIGSML